MNFDPTILPEKLPIPGFHFRSIQGEADTDALFAVHQGRVDQDGVDIRSTYEDFPNREGLRATLQEAVEKEEQDLWLVAQVHKQVVGYSQIESWQEEDGIWVYLLMGWVQPEWRGQGIGTAMVHWCQDTARRLAVERHPLDKYEFAANASSTEVDTTALLYHEGYAAGYTVLEMGWDPGTDLPSITLPDGIAIRPVSPEHYRLIAASIGEAYRDEYEGRRYQENFDPEEYVARISAPKHDPTLWRVAWQGEQVVGQVLVMLFNEQAEVFEVSVRPAWRRQKIARILLASALKGLQECGVEDVRLHTVAEFRTRASDLYRSVGFTVLKEFPRYRKTPGALG